MTPQPATRRSRGPEAAPIRAFLSYAHADDDFLPFVKAFKRDLERAAFLNAGGRNLEVLIDRESIDWGDKWWDCLQRLMDESAFFIPVVTRAYLDSDECRKEFDHFSRTAARLGREKVILPVVLSEACVQDESYPGGDSIVRAVKRLQYRDLHDALDAGVGSAEWSREIKSMAEKVGSLVPYAQRENSSGDKDPQEQPGDHPPWLMLWRSTEALAREVSILESTCRTMGTLLGTVGSEALDRPDSSGAGHSSKAPEALASLSEFSRRLESSATDLVALVEEVWRLLKSLDHPVTQPLPTWVGSRESGTVPVTSSRHHDFVLRELGDNLVLWARAGLIERRHQARVAASLSLMAEALSVIASWQLPDQAGTTWARTPWPGERHL